MTKDELILRIKNNMGETALDGDYLVFSASDPNWPVLDNFTLRELQTKNKKNTYTRLNLSILIELQAIREAWGKPIRVTSSYRAPEYNKSVNGATSSQHAKGNALDIQPVNGDIWPFKQLIKATKKTGGRGWYKTFVHIDVGRTRTWQG